MHTYTPTVLWAIYFVRTISVADRLLAVCLHFAILTCTLSVFATIITFWCSGVKISWLSG